MNLSHSANDVQGWVAALDVQGVDLSTNAHLKVYEEAGEFAADPCVEEAADVFISLMAACVNLGIKPADLAKAVYQKMVVNRGRVWAKMADGTYHHV